MRKDIFAVLTFVATGLLFYLVQTNHAASAGAYPEDAPEMVEKVSVPDAVVTTPIGITLKEGGSRDS